MDVLIKILAFIVAVSVLVAVHEFGHYWVARRLGFKVERFSIGFGRALWQWRGRDADRVEYRIAAIPLGGYVKLLDERDAPPDTPELERAFNRRPIPHRIAVLAAGPLFNFGFAVVAFWAMYVAGVPGVAPMVFSVEEGSPAARAGLVADDVIESVGGRAVVTWEGATFAILDELLASGVIDMQVRHADGTTASVRLDVRGRESELTEPEALFDRLGISPQPVRSPVAGEVVSGGAAEQAGVLVGDRFTHLDGVRITSFDEFAETVRARPGETVVLGLERNGAPIELRVTIAATEQNGVSVGQIGVGHRWSPDVIERLRALQTEQRFGLVEAFTRGAARTWEVSALTVRMLGRMVIGDVSLRNMAGPISIADYAGDHAQAGLSPFLSFLAVVSISLGILNLLPVPLLDGGQIVFQVAEWVKGAPMSERALAFGQQLGILFFILLISFVFYNDLTRVFG
jgi:regulator of sigma E protease